MQDNEFDQMYELEASHWWYAARRELLDQTLRKHHSENNEKTILDLASACGDSIRVCSKHGKAYGIDISSSAIHYCKKRKITGIAQGDVTQLPYKSKTFDAVVALDMFEHLEDDVATMREIQRVLKTDGILIFNVPAFMSLFSYHDVSFHHFRRYRQKEFCNKLLDAEFEVGFTSYWSFFIFPAIFVLRKLLNMKSTPDNEVKSDFYIKTPAIIDMTLKALSLIEIKLIKSGISLPFGVSLFGIARKVK